MANMQVNSSTHLNTFFGENDQNLNDFLEGLPSIPSRRLLSYLEYINEKAWDKKNPLIIDRIITHFNAKAAEGTLTIKLARRISAAINTFFQKMNANSTAQSSNSWLMLAYRAAQYVFYRGESSPVDSSKSELDNLLNTIKNDLIELECQTSDSDKQPLFVNKTLLFLLSPVWKETLKKNEKINLCAFQKNTVRYLKEFLETGKIDYFERNSFTPEELCDLIKLANDGRMTELLNYLAHFVVVNDGNFGDLFTYALDAQAIELFKKCLQSRFGERGGFKIKVRDFKHDHLTVEIEVLTAMTEKMLDEMCVLLDLVRKNYSALSAIKCFKVILDTNGLPRTIPQPNRPNNEPSNRDRDITSSMKMKYEVIGIGNPNLQEMRDREKVEPKLSYPPSFKDMLTRADFSHCDFKLFQKIDELVGQCKKLQWISLSSYVNTEQLGKLSKLVEVHTHVTSLHLALYPDKEGIIKNIDSLRDYPKLVELITSLNLEECRITNDELEQLVKICPKAELKLSYSKAMNDFFVSRSHLITSLDLSEFAEDMNDTQLENLLKGCTKLKKLYLSGFYKMTDRVLKVVAEKCPSLRGINLSGCNAITDEGVMALAQGCPKLVKMDLQNCYNVTHVGIEVLKEEYSHIRELN